MKSEESGSRVDKWFRRGAVWAMSVAASLFGFVFFALLFGALSQGRQSILFDPMFLAAALGFGAMAALTAFMAWRFSSGKLSVNGTSLPTWVLWIFGLMMVVGFVFAMSVQYRDHPRELAWWLVLAVVWLVLALILRRAGKERLISYLLFAFWIAGDYFLDGAIAWLPIVFLTLLFGLLVAEKVHARLTRRLGKRAV
jgi:MFS family permease